MKKTILVAFLILLLPLIKIQADATSQSVPQLDFSVPVQVQLNKINNQTAWYPVNDIGTFELLTPAEGAINYHPTNAGVNLTSLDGRPLSASVEDYFLTPTAEVFTTCNDYLDYKFAVAGMGGALLGMGKNILDEENLTPQEKLTISTGKKILGMKCLMSHGLKFGMIYDLLSKYFKEIYPETVSFDIDVPDSSICSSGIPTIYASCVPNGTSKCTCILNNLIKSDEMNALTCVWYNGGMTINSPICPVSIADKSKCTCVPDKCSNTVFAFSACSAMKCTERYQCPEIGNNTDNCRYDKDAKFESCIDNWKDPYYAVACDQHVCMQTLCDIFGKESVKDGTAGKSSGCGISDGYCKVEGTYDQYGLGIWFEKGQIASYQCDFNKPFFTSNAECLKAANDGSSATCSKNVCSDYKYGTVGLECSQIEGGAGWTFDLDSMPASCGKVTLSKVISACDSYDTMLAYWLYFDSSHSFAEMEKYLGLHGFALDINNDPLRAPELAIADVKPSVSNTVYNTAEWLDPYTQGFPLELPNSIAGAVVKNSSGKPDGIVVASDAVPLTSSSDLQKAGISLTGQNIPSFAINLMYYKFKTVNDKKVLKLYSSILSTVAKPVALASAALDNPKGELDNIILLGINEGGTGIIELFSASKAAYKVTAYLDLGLLPYDMTVVDGKNIIVTTKEGISKVTWDGKELTARAIDITAGAVVDENAYRPYQISTVHIADNSCDGFAFTWTNTYTFPNQFTYCKPADSTCGSYSCGLVTVNGATNLDPNNKDAIINIQPQIAAVTSYSGDSARSIKPAVCVGDQKVYTNNDGPLVNAEQKPVESRIYCYQLENGNIPALASPVTVVAAYGEQLDYLGEKDNADAPAGMCGVKRLRADKYNNLLAVNGCPYFPTTPPLECNVGTMIRTGNPLGCHCYSGDLDCDGNADVCEDPQPDLGIMQSSTGAVTPTGFSGGGIEKKNIPCQEAFAKIGCYALGDCGSGICSFSPSSTDQKVKDCIEVIKRCVDKNNSTCAKSTSFLDKIIPSAFADTVDLSKKKKMVDYKLDYGLVNSGVNKKYSGVMDYAKFSEMIKWYKDKNITDITKFPPELGADVDKKKIDDTKYEIDKNKGAGLNSGMRRRQPPSPFTTLRSGTVTSLINKSFAPIPPPPVLQAGEIGVEIGRDPNMPGCANIGNGKLADVKETPYNKYCMELNDKIRALYSEGFKKKYNIDISPAQIPVDVFVGEQGSYKITSDLQEPAAAKSLIDISTPWAVYQVSGPPPLPSEVNRFIGTQRPAAFAKTIPVTVDGVTTEVSRDDYLNNMAVRLLPSADTASAVQKGIVPSANLPLPSVAAQKKNKLAMPDTNVSADVVTVNGVNGISANIGAKGNPIIHVSVTPGKTVSMAISADASKFEVGGATEFVITGSAPLDPLAWGHEDLQGPQYENMDPDIFIASIKDSIDKIVADPNLTLNYTTVMDMTIQDLQARNKMWDPSGIRRIEYQVALGNSSSGKAVVLMQPIGNIPAGGGGCSLIR